MRNLLIVLLAAMALLWLSGRGTQLLELPFLADESPGGDLSSLPARVHGVLEIDESEGRADDQGYRDMNRGVLTVGGRDLFIEVRGTALSRSGLAADHLAGPVSAVLESRRGDGPEAIYTISSVSRR